MPLAVCATPIGNLEDVTLRVLARAPRGGRRALRGHAADAHPARPARDRGAALSYHRHNEAARDGGGPAAAGGGERIALVSDAGLPGVNDPGARLVAAALAAGVAGDGAAGPVGGRDGARRERPRRRAVPVRRLPAARRRRAARAVARARALAEPVVAFESPRRLPALARACSRRRCPSAQAAVCRELTKRFEEVVRGTARRARGAVRRAAAGRDHPRARCGAVRSRRSDVGEALAAVAELVAAGAGAAAGRRRRRPPHGRAAERPLPRLSVTTSSSCVDDRWRRRSLPSIDVRSIGQRDGVVASAAASSGALVVAREARSLELAGGRAVLRAFSSATTRTPAASTVASTSPLGDAPARARARAGEVTFAGTVPTHGLTVTIATADGYKASLTHLGPLARAARRRRRRRRRGRRAGPVRRSRARRAVRPPRRPRAATETTYVDPLALLPPRGAAARSARTRRRPLRRRLQSAAPLRRRARSALPLRRPPAPAPPATPSPSTPRSRRRPASARRRRSRRRARSAAPRGGGASGSQRRTRRRADERRRSLVPRPRAAGGDGRRDGRASARASRPSARHRSTVPTTSGRLRPRSRETALRATRRTRAAAAVATPPSRAVGPPAARRGPRRRRRRSPQRRVDVARRPARAPRRVARSPSASVVAGGRARDDSLSLAAVSRTETPEEDPGGGGLAVCERAAPHRPRRGVRRPVGHVRPLSPAAGQRRAHGQRDGRARHARHGRGGRRGRVAA